MHRRSAGSPKPKRSESSSTNTPSKLRQLPRQLRLYSSSESDSNRCCNTMALGNKRGLCPSGASNGCQTARRQLDAGGVEPSHRALDGCLYILCQAAIAVEPGKVRSPTQRRGSRMKPLAASERLTISMVQLPRPSSAPFSSRPSFRRRALCSLGYVVPIPVIRYQPVVPASSGVPPRSPNSPFHPLLDRSYQSS
jgi:hypothetical protein